MNRSESALLARIAPLYERVKRVIPPPEPKDGSPPDASAVISSRTLVAKPASIGGHCLMTA